MDIEGAGDEVLIDPTLVEAPEDAVASMEQESLYPTTSFTHMTPAEMSDGRSEFRKIPVPPHRMAPLRGRWLDLCNPIVTHLKLQIRMNTRTRNVEIKVRRGLREVVYDRAAFKGGSPGVSYLLEFEARDSVLISCFVRVFERVCAWLL